MGMGMGKTSTNVSASASEIRLAMNQQEPEMASVTQSPRPLSEHNPLASLTLPGVGEIEPEGLVLIVGPNSSGKTQLLQDIHLRLLGQSRPFVVCDKVQIRKPAQFVDFLATLIEEGYVREKVEANGDKVLQTRTTHFGTGQPMGDKILYREAEHAYNSVSLDPPGTRANSGSTGSRMCGGVEDADMLVLIGVTFNKFQERDQHVHEFTLPCIWGSRL